MRPGLTLHRRLAALDRMHVWHPFTQMRDWMDADPIVLVSGKGAVLRDAKGGRYLDANSSIWTNLHGHRNPKIDGAIRAQLRKVAHTSALGFANEAASVLAGRLVRAARMASPARGGGDSLERVFYSDDGSTALEVALKMAFEFARRVRGQRKPRFVSMAGAYHGDTVGAVSLGHIDLFHGKFGGLCFKTDQIMAPYCYRCPFNRASPERADARSYRRCGWECVDSATAVFERATRAGRPYAGFAFEPLMQGAAGMIPQPEGWLRRVAGVAREHGALLIADEVMTGFGRAVVSPAGVRGVRSGGGKLFASHQEEVQPDFLCLAKGLTGGYLPMAATLTTEAVFEAFLGAYGEFKSFFHGHSYTGNPLGASAALASLDLLETGESHAARVRMGAQLDEELSALWAHPVVGDIRRVGLVAGIELVRDWRLRAPFDLKQQAGIRVCRAMARRGVLTRPIGNVVVIMPPYCSTPKQVSRMVRALGEAIVEVFGLAASR